MINTFNELIAYLRNPVLEKDSNTDTQYRLRKFFHLLIISIITSLILTPLFSLVEAAGLVNMEEHKMTELMKQFTKGTLFLFTVVVAPLFEELIFRAPLVVFKEKTQFRIAFYIFAIVFGLVHLTNFKITPNILLLAPVLVAPQIILGSYLGFIRIKFGLIWSILLHATYNAFFILLSFTADSL